MRLEEERRRKQPKTSSDPTTTTSTRKGFEENKKKNASMDEPQQNETVHDDYTQEGIANMVHSIYLIPARLLLYDPNTDSIQTFTVAAPSPNNGKNMMKDGKRCSRCEAILPILVKALLELRPQRFQPNQPPFQLLFWDADFTFMRSLMPPNNQEEEEVQLEGEPQDEDSDKRAPILHFGSYMKNKALMDSNIHVMPNPAFLPCLREWSLLPQQHQKSGTRGRRCQAWEIPFGKNMSWDALKPQVVWRGSSHKFLRGVDKRHVTEWLSSNDTDWPMYPRHVLTDMSQKEASSWLDARFDEKMTLSNLSMHRYQLDVGGAGGTTWTGTLEKLAMPGLLFHHETPSREWFYDDLVAWQHYVPIRMDLSDLKARYEWAESSLAEAKAIAERGTTFASEFFSHDHLQQEYATYFGSQSIIGKIVDAYQPKKEESVRTIMSAYENMGVSFHLVSNCSKTRCGIRTRGPRIKSYEIHKDACYKTDGLLFQRVITVC